VGNGDVVAVLERLSQNRRAFVELQHQVAILVFKHADAQFLAFQKSAGIQFNLNLFSEPA
jgi:hypothetical protein